MSKNLSKIKNFFSGIGKTLLLAVCCFVAGFVIVFPVWKFATCAPRQYTLTVLVLIAGLAAFFVVSKIINRKNGS